MPKNSKALLQRKEGELLIWNTWATALSVGKLVKLVSWSFCCHNFFLKKLTYVMNPRWPSFFKCNFAAHDSINNLMIWWKELPTPKSHYLCLITTPVCTLYSIHYQETCFLTPVCTLYSVHYLETFFHFCLYSVFCTVPRHIFFHFCLYSVFCTVLRNMSTYSYWYYSGWWTKGWQAACGNRSLLIRGRGSRDNETGGEEGHVERGKCV